MYGENREPSRPAYKQISVRWPSICPESLNGNGSPGRNFFWSRSSGTLWLRLRLRLTGRSQLKRCLKDNVCSDLSVFRALHDARHLYESESREFASESLSVHWPLCDF